MTEAEAAWVAGIVEGEGSLYPIGRQSTYVLAVKMTDVDVVEKLQRVTGMGRVATYPSPNPERGHKGGAIWKVAKEADREALIDALLPHLGLRRTARVEEMRARMAAIKGGI